MLPKIALPTRRETLPSTGKSVTLRPMQFREEKVILMARETEDQEERARAIADVTTACVGDEGTEGWTTYDLDYIFIKLRASSIDNITRQTYIDNEDRQPHEIEIDLDKVVIKRTEDRVKTVQVSDSVALSLRDIPMQAVYDPDVYNENSLAALMRWSIESVWEGDKMVPIDNEPRQDAYEFIESLPLAAVKGVREWISSSPTVWYEAAYTNSLGNEKKIVLSSLADFFTL